VNLAFENQTLSIYQQVAFSALHFLAAVVTTLFSAHSGSLDRLAIHYACTGLRISLPANPQAFPHCGVDPLPGTIDAPFS
jgi:hypothetical protein